MHYTSNLDILCMPVAFVYIPLTWILTCRSLLHSPCTWHVHLFSCSRSQHAMLIKCDLLKHGIFFFFLFLNNRHQNIEGFGIWTHCTFLFQYSFKPKCYCYYLKVCCEYLAVTSFPFLFYCRHSESWTQRMKFFTDKTPIRLWLVLIHTIVLI